MAYSVDWVAKIITIPTSDLTLVSGTRYSLQMTDFLGECRRLEAAFDEGLWAPQILDHTNPKLDFAGVDYAGFDEVINEYTVQVSGVATRVDLLGSNNNIVDVLIPTGVAIVPSNSTGLAIGKSTVQWTDVMEGGMSAMECFRMMMSETACKMTYTDNGNGTYTARFRDIADSKDRMVVTGPITGGKTTVVHDAS